MATTIDDRMVSDASEVAVCGMLAPAGDAPCAAPALQAPQDRSGITGQSVQIRYYESDDSVFANGVYLIKGLAGRILWLLLTLHGADGRTTFSNRELRLHPFLSSRGWKNNLEARLLLLQRRLDAKAAVLRICREQRGHVTLVYPLQLDLTLRGLQPVA